MDDELEKYDFIKTQIGDEQDYFYTERGELVYKDSDLPNDKFLVCKTYFREYNHGDCWNSEITIEHDEAYVYSGKLYTAEGFKMEAIVHEDLKRLDLKKKEIEKEISELSMERYKIQQENLTSRRGQDFENSHTFMTAWKLMSNTKRFIIILENRYNCYVVDNLDKRVVGYNQDEDDYYMPETRYKDIEFTIYRDFSRYGNPKDKLFNFNIKLTKDAKESWRDNDRYMWNKDFKCEIEMVDTREEMQVIFDQWVLDDKISTAQYINVVDMCGLEVNPEYGQMLKDRVIQSINASKRSTQDYLDRYTKELVDKSNEVDKAEKIDPTDIEKIKEHIKGRYI